MKMNLYQILKGKSWFLTKWNSLLLLPVLMATMAFGQERSYTISGTVKDKNGTLPGVSILLDGTSAGTTSDADGKYSLPLSTSGDQAKLTFSFIGFLTQTQSVSLGTAPAITLDVTMDEDVKQLDEVVVIGSTIRANKRELGNQISSINSEMLQKSGAGDLFGSLQGKLPGAQITQNSGDPAGGMTIRLRGIKSLQGGSDPLYVIDGVVVSNSTANVSQSALGNQVGSASIGNNRMVDLNPSDVESINVINGAAAAAQYGSRASNGVVIITTKKGKQGKMVVKFSTAMNMNELRKKVPITTLGKQFGSVALRLHTISGQASPVPAVGETVTPITRDGVLTHLRSNQVDVTRYDYQDQIFQKGYGTDNNVSVSGGTEKTQYNIAMGYLKNEGIIKGTDFTRYNFRARVEQRLADWAKMSAGISYSNSFTNEKANGNVFYSPINSINITNNIYDITVRDAAGKLMAVEPTRVNPLSTIEDMNFTQSVNRTVNDLQLNLTPFKGFGIDWIIGVDTYSQVGYGLIKPYPYQAAAGLPLERYPTGYASHANNSVLLFNTDLNFSYERQLTSDIKISALAGINYQFQRADFMRTSGEGLAPFIETVSGATSTTVTGGYGLDRFSLSGYFGQATVGYKNLAFVTGAIRSDKSSKFSPGEATQTYPKFSASFVPSDLDFWKNGMAKYVSSLKVRTSWGQAGNFLGIGSYDRFWQYSPVAFQGRNTIVPSSQLANQSVRPERMTELEYGIDIGVLNNKITIGATFYQQSIEDLVVNRVLAPSEGGLSIVNNVGEMENKGLEIALNATAFKTKDFQWDLTFIYNRNRNKVTRLGSPTLGISTSTGAPIFHVQGQPASVFYGTGLARNPDGSLLLTPLGLLQNERGTQVSATPMEYAPSRDANGQPTGAAVRKIIGNPNPDFTGSIMSNFAYKNLNFNFLFDFVQGVSVFNADKRTRQGVGIGDYAEKELTGELPRGYIYAMYLTEEWRVDDGSFTKLREIGLSYDFKNLVKGVSNINLGVSGRNLFSWDKYNGYDPETNAGGNSDTFRGVDFGNVPIPRSYRMQLTVTF